MSLKIHRHAQESLVIVDSRSGDEIWIVIDEIVERSEGRAPKVGVCIQAPCRYRISRKELYEQEKGIRNPSPLHNWSRST